MGTGSARLLARRVEIGERLDAIEKRTGDLAPRRAEISERLNAIQEQMGDLAQRRAALSRDACREQSGRLEAAQRHALAAQAAARQALAFAALGFRLSAEAHEHFAAWHERAVAHGWAGDVAERSRQAAAHRAAANADRQRARRARVLLSGTGLAAPGPYADLEGPLDHLRVVRDQPAAAGVSRAARQPAHQSLPWASIRRSRRR